MNKAIRPFYLIFLALSFSFRVSLSVAQYTVATIPNQKLINNSYVSNPDKILDEGTVSQIDTLLRSLEKRTSVQIAVVAVESIGDADIFQFSQDLFVTWKIGHPEKDNGLLILLAKENRTIRFHTGKGLEGVLPDIACRRIQRDFMVPEFKNDNYNAGMLGGITQVDKVLSDPQYAEELKVDDEDTWGGFIAFLMIFFAVPTMVYYFVKWREDRFSDSKDPEYTPYPEMRSTRWGWLFEYVGVPALIVTMFGIGPLENPKGYVLLSLYLYYMLTLFNRQRRMRKVIKRYLATQSYYEIVEFIRKDQVFWFFMGLIFPVPFLFYFFYHLARKRLYRNHPRKCERCESKLRKLSEKKEDEFLSKAQQMEETLKAIDYDVWQCESCKAIAIWNYPNRHSKYDACPKCKTLAYYFVSRRTLEDATYSSSGKGEDVHTCKFCGYSRTSTYTISQLTASSSSDSSSSDSSSSSSDSGGSWGGGDSGGGGASSSW